MPSKAIIIGAGVVGLATARALAENGFQVEVFERGAVASGASIRNFGMLWPIGQRSGLQYERAMRTKSIWKQITSEMGAWLDENGSLHLAQTSEEEHVMKEIADLFSAERPVYWLNRAQLENLHPGIFGKNIIGGLWSRDEAIVESRKIIRELPAYLQERYGVKFNFQQPVFGIQQNRIFIGNRIVEADIICICSGIDFANYNSLEFNRNFTTCKLQMMRTVSQFGDWRMGPSICGGLSLAHYSSFEEATSLPKLKAELRTLYQEYLNYGIHVMACQNHLGELTIGDSHEYDLAAEPFDKQVIQQLIVDYLKQLVNIPDLSIQQSWNGYYAKLRNGQTEYFKELEPGIWAINGFGGAGMTLSFGTIEEFCRDIKP